MKPDWNDAPEWANYLAQDDDGCWNWYEKEPKLGRAEWLTDGHYENAGCNSRCWEDTLEQRPAFEDDSRLRRGTNIDHMIYGKGVVLGYEDLPVGLCIVIEFETGGVTKLVWERMSKLRQFEVIDESS